MNRKLRILLLLLTVSLLLSGCALKTVEELYCLPKRSQTHNNLQSVIDEAMDDLEYCAPQSGDNRQVVQSADLDGDGVDEYLLLAKDHSDKPLKILIFCKLASGYVLMDTIEGYGFGFDFVSFRQMDDRPGMEIVVGRLVGEEVVRSVSVYRFSSGFSRHMLSTAYSRMTVADLDGNGMCELFLLNQAASENAYGTVTVYAYQDEELHRSVEFDISTPASGYKQIITSGLADGSTAVYVTCSHNDMLITDVFDCKAGQLSQLASGLTCEPIDHNYVYPADIDADNVLELPRLIPMRGDEGKTPRYLVQWYSIDTDGVPVVKMHTFHNFQDNWYIRVEDTISENLIVERLKNQCTFSLYDPLSQTIQPIYVITNLQDADREELAQTPGRIVLYSGETVIYVADLLEAAEEYRITQETLITSFSPIRLDLNSKED